VTVTVIPVIARVQAQFQLQSVAIDRQRATKQVFNIGSRIASGVSAQPTTKLFNSLETPFRKPPRVGMNKRCPVLSAPRSVSKEFLSPIYLASQQRIDPCGDTLIDVNR